MDDPKKEQAKKDTGASEQADQADTGQPVVGGQNIMKKWLWWLLFVLLLLLLVFGWWWFKMRNDDSPGKATTGTNSQSDNGITKEEQALNSPCEQGQTNYENASLGFGFCYPASWGTVSVADAKLDASDTGSRWNLSFSDKDAVNLGVASADWETNFGRDGVCSDPASPVMPAVTPFSTAWTTSDDGGAVISAERGIEAMADDYLINEYAANILAEVVCLNGYTVLDGTPYTHTTASYSAGFTGAVPDPAAHMAAPDTLIPAAERNAFYSFVKSVRDL